MKEFFTTLLYVPMYNLLMFFVAVVPGHQAGLAIILVTIIIRLILLAPSIKATKSSLEMQKLQPLLNQIRAKYKKDQAMMSKEMMRTFKEHKVSPYGSCLPLIIQLVVLIIFYRVIMIGFNNAHFNLLYSFIPKPSEINLNFLWMDVSKPDLWILPILAGAFQFLQTKMMPQPPQSKNSNDPMAMMNKQMLYFFPILTIMIARSLPSGLVLYWIATSIIMILQQWYINSKFHLGFFGHFPEVPLEKLPEYTLEPESNSDGTEKIGKISSSILTRKVKAKGVEITVRRKK